MGSNCYQMGSDEVPATLPARVIVMYCHCWTLSSRIHDAPSPFQQGRLMEFDVHQGRQTSVRRLRRWESASSGGRPWETAALVLQCVVRCCRRGGKWQARPSEPIARGSSSRKQHTTTKACQSLLAWVGREVMQKMCCTAGVLTGLLAAVAAAADAHSRECAASASTELA